MLSVDYPYLRFLASDCREDYIQELVSTSSLVDCQTLVLTFDALVRDEAFVGLMRHTLRQLEAVYQNPVDIEFAVDIIPGRPKSAYRLILLQCRPLSVRGPEEAVAIPADLVDDEILFRTSGLVPGGKVEAIRYLVVVDPRRYGEIQKQSTRLEIGRAIGRLNELLAEERYILLGPGRWGSANIDLGVRVSYADIFNTKVLIEMAVAQGSDVPELSYGTHFFQDLVEGGIHSLPLHLNQPDSWFNWSFYDNAPNALPLLSPADDNLAPYLKVIDLARLRPPRKLTLLMDGEHDLAVALFEPGPPATAEESQLSSF